MRFLYIFSSIGGHMRKKEKHLRNPKMIALAKAVQDPNAVILLEWPCKMQYYADQATKKQE